MSAITSYQDEHYQEVCEYEACVTIGQSRTFNAMLIQQAKLEIAKAWKLLCSECI